MQPERSVHDNNVYAYVVDCERRRLVLHTEFRDTDPHELTDVVFQGVLAHQLANSLPGNILFDVAEVSIGEIVNTHEPLFAESWRHGWPLVEYGGDLNRLMELLQANGVRAYSVESSYGLCGWVLADRCERIARTTRAEHS